MNSARGYCSHEQYYFFDDLNSDYIGSEEEKENEKNIRRRVGCLMKSNRRSCRHMMARIRLWREKEMVLIGG